MFSLTPALLVCCLAVAALDSYAQIVLPSSGYINTVAGSGSSPFCASSIDSVGDGCLATAALLSVPYGVAVDSSGNLYIADNGNNRIRMVSASTGIISTIAGTGTYGFSGDGGAATSAELANPWGIALDSSGNVYFSDYNNNRIREIAASTGAINTIAGGGPVCMGATDIVGDGCSATAALLGGPSVIRVDSSGNVYIADGGNQRVRKVTASMGVISSVAGNGTIGFSGDGGAAASAEFNGPSGIWLDSSGDIWIADANNARIREVSASTGYVNTVAGGGSYPSCSGQLDWYGNGCPATSARLGTPMDVVVDASGNIYIADSSWDSVRLVSASSGIMTLFAGNLNYSILCSGATDSVGDGCLAANDGAALISPLGLGIDGSNNIYIADTGNDRIRPVGH
jgi:sugar lactone lactonase YvrE